MPADLIPMLYSSFFCLKGSNPSHVEDIVNITDKENQSLTEEICKSQNFTIQSTETRQQALTRDRVDEILNSSNHHEIFNSEEFMNQIEELISKRSLRLIGYRILDRHSR